MNDNPSGGESRYQLRIDTRDILGVAGAALILGGAAWYHPAAAVIVMGAALCGLAVRLHR